MPAVDNVSTIELVAQGGHHEDSKDVAFHKVESEEAADIQPAAADAKSESSDDNTKHEEATFLKLLQRNRPFRLYLLSTLVNTTGDWFTYIASIAVIESISDDENGETSRTAVGILVVVRLIPSLILMSVAGTLADSRDRRLSMMYLDTAASIVALLYIVAFELKSILGIYSVTFLLECFAALYEPSRASIIPMLVPDEEYLQKATALSGLVWSLMAAVGAALGGLAYTSIGAHGCVILDALTYFTSAYLIWLVGGTWNAAVEEEDKPVESWWTQTISMTVDGAKYLFSSSFGALVFVKASSGAIYGATYLLNVSFSEQVDDGHSSERLGTLFAFMGVGCLVGTLASDYLTDMSKPSLLQLACVISLGLQTLGVFGMAAFSPFWSLCIMTIIESTGSSSLWNYSSLLLQKFSTPDMLGRVCAVEFFLYTLTEAISTMVCGYLQDQVDLSARTTSFLFGCFGSILVLLWACYHVCHQGYEENQDYSEVKRDNNADDDDEDDTTLCTDEEGTVAESLQ